MGRQGQSRRLQVARHVCRCQARVHQRRGTRPQREHRPGCFGGRRRLSALRGGLSPPSHKPIGNGGPSQRLCRWRLTAGGCARAIAESNFTTRSPCCASCRGTFGCALAQMEQLQAETPKRNASLDRQFREQCDFSKSENMLRVSLLR